MLKLCYRAKWLKKEQRGSSAQIYTAFLSIVLCMVCLAGTTWAWFTANQTAPVGNITSARYAVAVHVMTNGESVAAREQCGDLVTYSLDANKSYTVSLTTGKDSTASTGYCLVSIDNKVYYTSPITAETTFSFTYQTGVEVPDGLTKAAYEKLVSEAKDTSLTVAWYWGTYPNTQDFVTLETDPGYTLLENGAVLGTAPGEAPQDAGLVLDLTGFDLGDEAGDTIPLRADHSLVLMPNEGCELPEAVTVEIDGTVYKVYTDGLEHREIPLNGETNEPDMTLLPPMPTFDPLTNTLTIPAVLLTEEIRSVTVAAAALEMEAPECICEIKCTDLNGDCPVCRDALDGCLGTEAAEPAEEPTETADPADETDPTDTTDPAESAEAAEPSAPTEPVTSEPPTTTERAETDPPDTIAAGEETTVTELPVTSEPLFD